MNISRPFAYTLCGVYTEACNFEIDWMEGYVESSASNVIVSIVSMVKLTSIVHRIEFLRLLQIVFSKYSAIQAQTLQWTHTINDCGKNNGKEIPPNWNWIWGTHYITIVHTADTIDFRFITKSYTNGFPFNFNYYYSNAKCYMNMRHLKITAITYPSTTN